MKPKLVCYNRRANRTKPETRADIYRTEPQLSNLKPHFLPKSHSHFFFFFYSSRRFIRVSFFHFAFSFLHLFSLPLSLFFSSHLSRARSTFAPRYLGGYGFGYTKRHFSRGQKCKFNPNLNLSLSLFVFPSRSASKPLPHQGRFS